MVKEKLINILTLLQQVPEKEVEDYLLSFSCPPNPSIEHFLHCNAISFAKAHKSITYLLIDSTDSALLGFFTLTHKPTKIPAGILSNKQKNKVERCALLENDEFHVSAFLIAQFSKNMSENTKHRISGDLLMDYAFSILQNVQAEIGGTVVFLECENIPNVLAFYQNTHNKFYQYGNRFSKKDNINYLQLMRAL